MHEQSETVQRPDGRWVNVFGRSTPRAGQPLDGLDFGSMEEAVTAAQARSASGGWDVVAETPIAAAQPRPLALGGSPWDVVDEQPIQPALPEPYAYMRDFGLGEHARVSALAAQPKPPPDRIGENLTGANKGIFGMMGAPVDILNSTIRSVAGADTAAMPSQIKGIVDAMKLLGLDKMGGEPFGGSASIQRGAEAAGVPTVEPVDRQGRITSRILEEIFATLMPAGAAVRMGAKAKMAGKVEPDSFIAPFANAPKREIVNQTALAGAAGTGAAASTEVFGDGPAADITGALFGGMAGSNAARMGGLGVRTAGDILNPKRVGREEVGRKLVTAMTDKRVDPDTGKTITAGENTLLGDRLAESRALERDVPGLKLTTGEATTDPGLQDLEFKRGSSGPNPGGFERQRQGNRQAVNAALDEVAPKADSDAATRRKLEERRDTAVGKAVDIEAGRAAKVEDARGAADPGMSRQASGEVIRGEITGELAKARAEERDLWRSIDPDGKTEVDTRPLRERAKAILDETPRAEAPEDTSDTIRKIAGDTEKPELTGRAVDPDLMAEAAKADEAKAGLLRDKESFEEMLALKSRLSDEIRAERAAAAPNRNRIRKLSMMLDETMTTLEKSADASPENAGAVERFRAANEKSRELNERFTRGEAVAASAVDSRGGKRVEDSELAGKFFKPGANGSVEALEDFERAVGGSAKAKRALRAYALDDARRAAIVDGRVDTKKLEGWIAKHKDALDRYPDIRDELGNLGAAQKSLERAGRRREMLEKGLNDPKRSTIAKYLDTDDAGDSMDAILRSKNPRREMTNLVNTLKRDPDALEGAKRAFWGRMRASIDAPTKDAANNTVVTNVGFQKFLKQHGDAARILYADAPEHLKRLERIAEAVEAAQRTTKIKAPGTSGTPQGMAGLTLAGVVSRVYALKRGVIGLPYVLTEATVRGGKAVHARLKREEIDRLLDQALLDPDVAKTLVMEWNKSNQRVIERRLALHLGHELQIGAAEAADEDEEKPPKKEK